MSSPLVRGRVRLLAANGALLVLALASIGPLLWMVSVSLMPAGEASALPPPLLPSRPTLDNYAQLFARIGIGRYLVNSLLLATTFVLVRLGRRSQAL